MKENVSKKIIVVETKNGMIINLPVKEVINLAEGDEAVSAHLKGGNKCQKT